MAIDIEKITIEILFNNFHSDEARKFFSSEKEAYLAICEAIVDEFVDDDKRLKEFPYPKLTKYVYSSDEIPDEENEFLLKNLNGIKNYCKPDDKIIIDTFCEKFLNHYRLSKMQKEFMINVSRSANEISKKAESSAENAQNIIEETKKATDIINDQIENMENTKGTIYTEFIAILGIFSALIFGLFGGFQGLSEAIVKLSTDWSVGRVLIIGSGIMMCLTLLIFGLLQWVARITGRKLTSCDCYENKEECKHSLFRRHRTLFSLALSFIFIFILGEYIETFEKYSNISETWMFIPLAWLIPILLILIVLFVTWNVFDLKKWNSERKSKKNN